MLAIGQVSPRLAEWMVERFGAPEVFRRVAASRGRIDRARRRAHQAIG